MSVTILSYVLLNGLGATAAVLCWLLARRSRVAAMTLATILLALMVCKSAINHKPAWEVAIFPWSWYIYLQGYWLYAIGAIFFAVASPLLPVPRNRRAIAGLGIAVLCAGGLATSWMLYLPRVGADRHADSKHQCTQSTGFTCAPTACVCALSYVGIDSTEREMAHLCLTRPGGTTRFNTYRGLVLKCEGTPWRPIMAELPPEALCVPGTVAVIDFPEEVHAITTYGVGDGVTLHDPLSKTPLHLSLDELRSSYGGLAITLQRR